MKTTIQKQTHKCDFCKKEVDYPDTCLKCGKEACYDCSDKEGIEYSHAVHFRGSGDGWYCNKCDGELRTRMNRSEPPDPVHRAFLAIHNFKLMLEAQYEQNKRETARLEAELQKVNKAT